MYERIFQLSTNLNAYRYKLAADIDGQLKQMVQDLKSIIDHLNVTNSIQKEGDDPVSFSESWIIVITGSLQNLKKSL